MLYQDMSSRMRDRLPPPQYLNLLLVLQLGLYILLPTWRMIHTPWTYLGGIFVLVGLTLNIRATKQLKAIVSLDSSDIHKSLEMSGAYRISRNPIYLGGVIFSVGIAILLGTLVIFIFPIILFILLDRLYIPVEEKRLEKIFGQIYLQYKKKVKRWI